MSVIRGATAVRDAYRDERAAVEYIERRFREPLGALLHRRQVEALEKVIRTCRPRDVLEIAPGPARLTTDIAALLDHGGTLIDASAQMLDQARRRLTGAGRRGWRCVQGDAFQLPFQSAFDLVFTFRLIRHFERADRLRLYRQIAGMLRPQGLLVFDVVNETVSAPMRALAKPGEYQHFDALLRPETLEAELSEAGLATLSLHGVQHRYALMSRVQALIAPRSRPAASMLITALDRFGGGEPLEWIVTCRRA